MSEEINQKIRKFIFVAANKKQPIKENSLQINHIDTATGSCEGTNWSSSRAATFLIYKNKQKKRMYTGQSQSTTKYTY